MELTWKLLEEASETANHCQRNWDRTKQISDEEVNTLIKVATNMPTKQNRNFYDLIVSKDPKINSALYSKAIDRENMEGTEKRNSQVNGHLTFIYVNKRFHDVEQELRGTEKLHKTKDLLYNHELHTNLSIGISSGAVALAANQMGLRSGFCCCYDMDMILDYFKKIGHELNGKIVLMLGVGYPNTKYDSNVVLDEADEKILKTVHRHKKSIKHKLL